MKCNVTVEIGVELVVYDEADAFQNTYVDFYDDDTDELDSLSIYDENTIDLMPEDDIDGARLYNEVTVTREDYTICKDKETYIDEFNHLYDEFNLPFDISETDIIDLLYNKYSDIIDSELFHLEIVSVDLMDVE